MQDSKTKKKWTLSEEEYNAALKVEVGGWVLAHDTTVPPFASQLEKYLSFVRGNKYFRESISFDIDPFGLELSIK